MQYRISGVWVPDSSAAATSVQTAATTYGAYFTGLASGTDATVAFSQYQIAGSSYNSCCTAATNWGTAGTGAPTAWRLVKSTIPQAVGFGLLQSGQSGLFPAAQSQLDDVTATRLGYKAYLSGTNYNGGISPTVTGTTVVTRALFIPYQLQDGTWHVRFNMDVNVSSNTAQTITVNGVVFKTSINQAVAFSANVATAAIVHTSSGAATITGTFASAITNLRLSGDVELDSKPTWAY